MPGPHLKLSLHFINSFNIPRLQDSHHTLLYLMLRSRLVRRLGWRHGLRCWGSCWWWRSVSWRRIRSGRSCVVVVVGLSRGQGARRRLFSWRSVAWWVEGEGWVILVVRVGVGVWHWAGAREVWSGRSLEWGGSMVTSSFTVRGSVSVSPLWTQSPGLLRWSGVGEGQLTRLSESAGAGVASTAGARCWDWSRGQDLVTWSPSLTPTASLHHHRVSGDHQLTQSHHPQSSLSTLHSCIVKEADALVSVTNMDYTGAGGYISPHKYNKLTLVVTMASDNPAHEHHYWLHRCSYWSEAGNTEWGNIGWWWSGVAVLLSSDLTQLNPGVWSRDQHRSSVDLPAPARTSSEQRRTGLVRRNHGAWAHELLVSVLPISRIE